MKRNKVIGVTGGSGSGKTVFCDVAREMGVYVINADDIAHDVLEGEAAAELVAELGTNKRAELREIVFADTDKLKLLNDITHKYILKTIEKMIKICDNTAIAIEAILLIESGAKAMCDEVVSIIAPKSERIKRASMRDGHDVTARIEAQATNEFYRQHSDIVIENGGTLGDLRECAENYWGSIIEGTS